MAEPTMPDPGAADAAPEGDATTGGSDPGFGQGADPAAAVGTTAASDRSTAPASNPVQGEAGEEPEPISVEDLVADLERVSTERDDYLDALRRLQAEFENYRKAVSKREADTRERANDKLVNELLPVIDACDGAVANGASDVEPIRKAIVENLTRQGLERLEPEGEIFDPEQHEAVMHEDSSDVDVPTVAEVLRVGYGWNGRVLRPAMVRTIG